MAASEMTDAELLTASVADSEQFALLFRCHGAPVHRYLARRLGSDSADDLTAEVFLVAFGKRARYSGSLPTALPRLSGIAGYVVARHRRDEARRWRLLSAIAPDLPHASHADEADARVTAWSSRAVLVEGLVMLHARDRERFC
ncbi:MAG: rpoE [Pseudonocardiales bacterium]|nr:rpoE [Pseudonocardiales bacterium]